LGVWYAAFYRQRILLLYHNFYGIFEEVIPSNTLGSKIPSYIFNIARNWPNYNQYSVNNLSFAPDCSACPAAYEKPALLPQQQNRFSALNTVQEKIGIFFWHLRSFPHLSGRRNYSLFGHL
jgi:hypothetical protein